MKIRRRLSQVIVDLKAEKSIMIKKEQHSRPTFNTEDVKTQE